MEDGGSWSRDQGQMEKLVVSAMGYLEEHLDI